jgi:hypothetical protein
MEGVGEQDTEADTSGSGGSTVVAGEWRKLHNEKLQDLYSSPNMVRVIKLRKMKLARHVAYEYMREKQHAYRVLVGKPEERDHLEDLGIEEEIMFQGS